MAQIPLSKKEIELTGEYRFRKQRLTGLSILQVAVKVRYYRLRFKLNDEITVEWRDATNDEAQLAQVMINR
ncbi:hypothetical protein [Providencia alcalifaciens]|uniref:hypothetical protein n=1 Tax=Providencia alcalifaciens TaxID=126385 RepID=UPI0004504FB0|nr:hypothetical protein [Providencia alcalifaciens]EUC94697.1 hypothetical protein HMPREF1567_0929 [Providencia alcalifaciens PAL-2]